MTKRPPKKAIARATQANVAVATQHAEPLPTSASDLLEAERNRSWHRRLLMDAGHRAHAEAITNEALVQIEYLDSRVRALEAQVADCRKRLQDVINKGLNVGMRELASAAYSADAYFDAKKLLRPIPKKLAGRMTSARARARR